MGEAVEHEGGRVGVSALVLPNEPVTYVAAGQQGGLQGAHLVEAVAGGAEDSGGDAEDVVGGDIVIIIHAKIKISLLVQLGLQDSAQLQGHRSGMVVHHIVEGAVDTVVDIECLIRVVAALARVHLSRDGGGRRHEVAPWLCDEAHGIHGAQEPVGEAFDARADRCSKVLESGHAGSTIAAGVPWESATDVDHVHGRKLHLVSYVENPARMVQCSHVCSAITAP